MRLGLVGSIEVAFRVRAGSDGFFPWHLLDLELELRDGRRRRLPLNVSVAGLDSHADLFPAPRGRVERQGDLSSSAPVDRDTHVRFFAFPTGPVDRWSVCCATLGLADIPERGRATVTIEAVRLLVDGVLWRDGGRPWREDEGRGRGRREVTSAGTRPLRWDGTSSTRTRIFDE